MTHAILKKDQNKLNFKTNITYIRVCELEICKCHFAVCISSLTPYKKPCTSADIAQVNRKVEAQHFDTFHANQTNQPVQLQYRDTGRDLCCCASTSNLTFIFEEQRGAVLNHFIVLALEQLALAVVEEQRCDHEVQFYPGLISRILLQPGSKSSQGKELVRCGVINEKCLV